MNGFICLPVNTALLAELAWLIIIIIIFGIIAVIIK